MISTRRRLLAIALAVAALVALALLAGVIAAAAWSAGKPTFACATGEHAGQYLVTVTWTAGGQPPDNGSLYLAPGASGTVRDHHGDHLEVTAPTATCTPSPSPSPPPTAPAAPSPTPTPLAGTPQPNGCQAVPPAGSCEGVGKG